MGVTLTRTTGKGSIRGGKTAVAGYTVTEDSTPRIPGDSSGGVGSITATVIESDDTILLSGAGIELYDSANGKTVGTVRTIASQAGEITVTADSRLAQLVVTRKANAYNGTLAGAFAYYFGLVGITSGFTVDSTIGTRPVIYTGFNDNVWNFLKNICIAEQVEISLVDGAIVVRPLRHETVDMSRNSQADFTVDSTGIALTAEVYYYNQTYVTNAQVYPNDASDNVIEIPQGETIVEIVPTNVSLVSIMQPAASTDKAQTAVIAADGGVKKSFYVVHDGTKEISQGAWKSMGGDVVVEIDPDNDTQLKITAHAPVSPTVSTYRLGFGISQEDGNFTYSPGLVIVGTGVRTKKELVRVATGANPAFVTEDAAPTVDNPAIRTREQAFRAARSLAAAYAGPGMSVEVSAARVHRSDWDTRGAGTPAVLTTTYVSEPFTGTTGAAWSSNWTTRAGTGTIQSNAGQITPQAVAYSYGRIDYTGMAGIGNTEITGSIVGGAAGVEQYAEIHINSDLGTTNNNWEPTNGYALLFKYDPTPANSALQLVQSVGGAGTQFPQVTKSLTGTTRYSFRFQRIGTALRARVWVYGTTEPTSWDVSTTLTSALLNGKIGLEAANGGAAVGRAFTFDDILVTDGVVAVPATGSGFQVLGNVAGARVVYRDNIFRTRSAKVSESGISYSAERDTLIEDFNSVWSGASFDDFNAAWAGYSFDDFSVMPLRRNG